MRKTFYSILSLCAFLNLAQNADAQIVWVPTAGNGPASTRSDSYNRQLTVWNGKLYFWGRNDTTGSELWSYDEISPAKMEYDLIPGLNSGDGGGAANGFGKMAVLKNKLYMAAQNSSSGCEVFAWSGSGAQVQVSNIGMAGPYDLVAFGSKLYFGSPRSTNGSSTTDVDLYSYDGINPVYRYNISVPATGLKGVNPFYITAIGKKLCFAGRLPSGKAGLYAIDTTTNVPFVVTNGAPAGDFNSISDLTLIGSKLYFIAGENTYGNEVWTYDGTTLKRETDVSSGLSSGAVQGFGYYKGEVYFAGCNDNSNKFQLYKISKDGPVVLVHTINPTGDARPHTYLVYKNNLYFVAKTGATGFELWKYDGTTCAMVADLYPGAPDGFTGWFDWAIYKNHLYFRGRNGAHLDELFRLNDPTTVENVKWNGEVKVYPNPASTSATLSMTLQSAQTLQIALFDGSGKEVYAVNMKDYPAGKSELALPLQGLAAGQYFYRISSANQTTLASGAISRQ